MKFGWRGALGVLISAVLVWWLITRSGINWGDAWRYMRSANIGLLVLSSAVATSIFPLRAKRWQIILDPVAPAVPIGKLWRAVAIGMMGNNVLPLRGGELARAYALSKEEPRVPFATGLASLFVDRIFDGISVLLLLFAAMLDPYFTEHVAHGNGHVAALAAVPAAALVVALAGLYTLVFFPDWCIGLADAITRRISTNLEHRVTALLRRFADGLSVLKSPRQFAAVFFWAVLHWAVNAFSFWIGFRALGIDAPYSVALFVQGIIVMGVAVPSSPGFVGVFESAGVAALVLYGFSRDLAGAWAVAYHAVSYIPITVFGLIYAARLGLHFREIQTGGDPSAPAHGQP